MSTFIRQRQIHTKKTHAHYTHYTVHTRDGKEPSLLEFGFVRVLPNIRVRSVRVLSSYGKMKVRFWFGSSSTVFGSVRFGSMRVLIHIYFSLHVYNLHRTHSVSFKKSTRGFLKIFTKRLGIFSPNFPCLLFFLSTLDYKFIFNYLQLWQSHGILSATVRPPSLCISRWWTCWAYDVNWVVPLNMA